METYFPENELFKKQRILKMEKETASRMEDTINNANIKLDGTRNTANPPEGGMSSPIFGISR